MAKLEGEGGGAIGSIWRQHGGGFYALVGKVTAEAGPATPTAFLLSAVLAALSALSFGELAARYPSSAGESRYVQEAFGKATARKP